MNTNWDDLKYFLAVAQCGTMSGAAEQLHTNPTTVSRRIKRLQEEFGFPVLERVGDEWRPAPAAAGLAETARRIQAAITNAEHDAVRHVSDFSGRIVVNAPPVVTALALSPKACAFVERFPGIELEIFNSTKVRSLARREADLALWATEPVEGKLLKRKVASFQFGIYRRRGGGEGAGWIGLGKEFDTGSLMRFAHHHLAGAPVLRFRTLSAVAQAMKTTGLAGPLPTCVAREHPDLEPVFEDPEGTESPIWLVYHESRRRDPVVEAGVDWLSEVFPNPRGCVCGACF